VRIDDDDDDDDGLALDLVVTNHCPSVL